MATIAESFKKLAANGRKAVMPFITAGDPTLDVMKEVLLEIDSLRPGIIEIGFPYSDPVADGPVIQESYVRALNAGVTVDGIFDTISSVQDRLSQPLVAMVSYAIVMKFGQEKFADRMKDAGFSAIIIPDVMWEEESPVTEFFRSRQIDVIPLVAPTTSSQRMKEIAAAATGFIYYISVAGVTGQRESLPEEVKSNVKLLQEHASVPVCVGFGISGPDQVQNLAPYCDGMIVGSAIVRKVAGIDPGNSDTQDVREFVQSLVDQSIVR